MKKSIKAAFEKIIQPEGAKAHCDVPCGIYDPIPAQIAAMTVARMTDTLIEKEDHEVSSHGGERGLAYNNTVSRMVEEKERSAELVKAEIRIIWGDFFKAQHFENNPNLHALSHEIMSTASKCKQSVDKEASRVLVEKVNDFATAFWQAKGIESSKVKYHCKPNLDIVFPKL